MTRTFIYFTIATLGVCVGLEGRAGAQQTLPSTVSGLWADLTDSYLLADPSHRWFCSTRGWTYLSTGSGGATTQTSACTTPAGNDLSWAGGVLSNVKFAGNEISFDRSNGVFGRSQNGCHITATLTSEGLRGTQTCTLKYTDPFGMTGGAEATVKGPYEAERASFTGPDLPPMSCGRERLLKPAGLAAGSLVLFENRTDRDFAVFPVSGDGRRITPGTPLPPGGTAVAPVPAANPLVLADAQGSCRAVYRPASKPAKVVIR